MATLDIAPDWLVQGIIGVVAGGAMLRSFLVGWVDAKAKLKLGQPVGGANGTMVTAVSIGWKDSQIEKIVQAAETLAAAASTYTQKEKDEAAAALLDNNALLRKLLLKLSDVEEQAIKDRLGL